MGEATGCVGGFTGPIGLHDCRVVVDSELVSAKNLCAGACEKDHHYINVNYGRDYKADIVTDLKLLQAGDPCPCCGKPVRIARGIEVGQVFKLGTKYSEAMHAYFKDENQQEHPLVMGCYGIGVTRTMAAIVEQYHDDNGIIWPMSVAPYHVAVVLLKPQDPAQAALAEKITAELEAQGAEVILDDRDERPGVKFKDMDLLGFPIRITVGKKAADGIVEYKLRRGGDMQELSAEDAVKEAITLINAERRG
jgi:prolyl-tRNA synthetase